MNVRAQPARALGRLRKDPTAVMPVLIAGLDDSDASAFEACAAALGRYGRDASAAVPRLSEIAANGTENRAALEAMRALRAIGTDEAADRLCDLAFGATPYTQQMSMQILTGRVEMACRCAERLKPEAADKLDAAHQSLAISGLVRLCRPGARSQILSRRRSRKLSTSERGRTPSKSFGCTRSLPMEQSSSWRAAR